MILAATSDYEKAAECSLRIFEAHFRNGNPVEGRTALFNAGLYSSVTDLNRALAIYERCLPLEREHSSDGRANPVVFAELAFVTRRAGDLERSSAYLAEALALCQERQESDPHGYVRTMRIAGTEALTREDLAVAQDCYEKSLFVARQLGDASAQANLLYNLAIIARETGDLSREEAVLSESLTVAGPDPRLPILLRLQKERAESLLVRGDQIGARRFCEPFCHVFRAKRMNAVTAEVKSSHVPYVSQPRAVVELIEQAAKRVEAAGNDTAK